MAGRHSKKAAPIFGQRLAFIRKRKGLSQQRLAQLLGTTRHMIDYYERRADNPTLDFIQRAAEVLSVSVPDLLGQQPLQSRAKPGPAPQLQLRFDEVRRLPRKHQEFILKFIDTYLELHAKS